MPEKKTYLPPVPKMSKTYSDKILGFLLIFWFDLLKTTKGFNCFHKKVGKLRYGSMVFRF